MTISTLIAELQKLQALHGDLPVTRPCEGDEQEEISKIEKDGGFFSDLTNIRTGPHIHLS